MLVRSVEMTGFMAHDRAVVELPANGVVVVTGSNGAGKSSLYEAVTWGTWGCTVRGTPPWRRDLKCVVKLVVDGLTIERGRRNRKVDLVWGGPSSSVTYETTTKAQEALNDHVPPYAVWRRTHLFTTADAWAFGLATDAQRKELLEGLLGLEVFDQGLQQCRVDLRVASARYQDARTEVATAAAKVSFYESQHRDLSAQAAPPVDAAMLAEVAEQGTKLRNMAQSVTREIDALRASRSALAVAGAQELAAAQVVRRRLHTLQGRAECPTCGAPVQTDLGALEREAQGLENMAGSMQRLAGDEARSFDAAIAELQVEQEALHQRARAAEVRHVQLHQQIALSERSAASLAQLETALVTARETLARAQAVQDAAAQEARVLAATEEILGLRGVRAQMLDGGLRAVEEVSNVWLARIAGDGLRLVLRPTQEKKNGQAVDVVSMQVEGAGEGYGYPAVSQGERRRLDVALLLAFAEIASAATPGALGTLWFDEVFDVLDPEGVEAVSAALQDLATERPVVVITHNDMLATRLRGARHLRVEHDGLTWA